MSDLDDLERRLAAVERAVTDGGRPPEAIADAAECTERIERLEERVDRVDERLAELEAAVQALRGYVGNVRSVNEEVRQTAERALTAATEDQTGELREGEAIPDSGPEATTNQTTGPRSSGQEQPSTQALDGEATATAGNAPADHQTPAENGETAPGSDPDTNGDSPWGIGDSQETQHDDPDSQEAQPGDPDSREAQPGDPDSQGLPADDGNVREDRPNEGAPWRSVPEEQENDPQPENDPGQQPERATSTTQSTADETTSGKRSTASGGQWSSDVDTKREVKDSQASADQWGETAWPGNETDGRATDSRDEWPRDGMDVDRAQPWSIPDADEELSGESDQKGLLERFREAL